MEVEVKDCNFVVRKMYKEYNVDITLEFEIRQKKFKQTADLT
jgi:hypothetical protein